MKNGDISNQVFAVVALDIDILFNRVLAMEKKGFFARTVNRIRGIEEERYEYVLNMRAVQAVRVIQRMFQVFLLVDTINITDEMQQDMEDELAPYGLGRVVEIEDSQEIKDYVETGSVKYVFTNILRNRDGSGHQYVYPYTSWSDAINQVVEVTA